jgi:hypothetical protein
MTEETKTRNPRKPRKPRKSEAQPSSPAPEERPALTPDSSEIGTVPPDLMTPDLMTGVNLTPSMPVNPHAAKRIAQFLAVRDRIDQLEEEHKRQIGPLKDILVQIHNDLLRTLHESGIDSIAVRGVGTAYRTERHSASITDPEMFKEFVIVQGAWNMLDWKANATAARTYALQTGEVPPGLDISTRVMLNVRKNP